MSLTFLVAGQSNANKLFDFTDDQVTAVNAAGQSQTLEYTVSEAVQGNLLSISVPKLQPGQSLFIDSLTVNGVVLNLSSGQVVPASGPAVPFAGQLTDGTLTFDLSAIAPRTPGPNGPTAPADYDVAIGVSGANTPDTGPPHIGVWIDGLEISGQQGSAAFAEATRHYFADPNVNMIDTAVNGSPVDSLVNPGTPYWWNLQTNTPGPLLLAAVASAQASGQPMTGIIWGQGEQEAFNLGTKTPKTSVDRYIQATEAVFAYFRAALGNPNLPIFIQQIGTEDPANKPPDRASEYNVIRTAQIQIAAAVPHVYIAASTYDLPHLPGGIHFTAPAYVTIGQRLAAFIAADLGAPNLGADPQPQMSAAQFVDRHTVDIALSGFAAADLSQAINPLFFTAADAVGIQAPLTTIWKAPGTIELTFAADLQGAAAITYADGTTEWLGDTPLMSTAGPVPLPLAAGSLGVADESLIVASSGVATLPSLWLLQALPGGAAGATAMTTVSGQGGLAASLIPDAAYGQDVRLATPHAGAYEFHYAAGTVTGDVLVQVVDPGAALIGTARPDVIVGGPGADTLDGGVGADVLYGGAGNDTYLVDNAGDQVIEKANAGTDTVLTTLSTYILPDNVEALIFAGVGDFQGKGNGRPNTLTGGAGNDTLDGGAGADVLHGGQGNDTYVVDNAGDQVSEAANEGVDTVKTVLASYTLGANIENLIHTGSTAFVGTGNALDNTITGSTGADTLSGSFGSDTLQGMGGADTLDGGPGADVMQGGAGNDIYLVDNVGDQVVEANNAGIDTVQTGLSSYTLPANVETLIYTGAGAFQGTGNTLGNTIVGGAAADVLLGGAGNDTLQGGASADHLTGGAGADLMTGGGGADVFVFDAVADSSGTGYDTITDFDAKVDHLDLWTGVTGLAPTAPSGALNAASLTSDLATIFDSNHLGAHQAALFTPTAGTLAGQTFLVVDVNGVAGYQAGGDLLIDLQHPLNISSFGVADFI